MVQEYLNREPDHLWAILTNGKSLRLLRDSTALVGQAYVDFNLQEIFDSEAFPDFVLLFAMCHESRLRRLPLDEGGDGESAVTNRWIERWRTDALASGTRALASLRGQVEKAIEALGTGYLAHPANQQLRDRLEAGEITAADYQRAVLRLVYRLLFWMVAEDRDVLFAPDSPPAARARYDTYFSSRRLRSLARNRVGTRHYDLCAQVDLVFNGLGSEAGMPELGLPALGGLFENTEVDVIAGLALPNHALLEAIRLLSTTMDANKQTRRSVDFRHLGAEELGSIYEGLLELHPRIDPVQRTFTLVSGAGNERKSTGSYYTPSSLIDLVLDNSLDPLLDRATATGTNEERQAALLALRVCDPACGSGHFLVAAARRIANRLARLRSDETEPSAAQVQAAVHEVVNNCIYGVDLMPMAAELAKVSLWLEAIQPGRPLGFLDAHIKVGNSLIGTTPSLLAAGIPDGAFGAVTGDDKQLAAMWRRRNAVERDRADQMSFLEDNTEAFSNIVLVDATKALNALPSLGLADVALARQRYRELRESPELLTIKRAADAWTAAFFQVKGASNPVPITTDTVRAFEQSQPVATEVLATVEALTGAHRFFHWHVEFPDIFVVPNGTDPDADPDTGWVGGFDAMIGNPPWERVKLQEKEFFAEADPAIASAPNAAARRRLIAALPTENPSLARAFIDAKRSSEAESQFVRSSGRYPLTGRGDVNTYAIFAETFRSGIRADGRAGIITPTGLATDATTAPFLSDTLKHRRLAAFFDFENRAPLFVGVDSRFRFAVCAMTGRAGIGGAVPLAFMLHDPADATARSFELSPEEILALNPNTGTLPVFASRRDADITLGIYRRHPILIRDGDPNGNPWGLSFSTMFHMSNDSHLFRTAEDLEAEGATFDGWAWTAPNNDGTQRRWLPLYEGRMGHIYNHRFADSDETPASITDLEQSGFEVKPASYVLESDFTERLARRTWPSDRSLFGFRRVARSNDVRTSIATAFPLAPASYGWILTSGCQLTDIPLLLASYNSLALDFCLRSALSQPSVPQSTYAQLPVPRRTSFEREIVTGILPVEWVTKRFLELTITSTRLVDFARELGLDGPPFRWLPERRATIQAELDALMMHIYGLERSEAGHILDSFPVLRKYEERDFGEFRTRRLVLDFYDRMAAATESGIPYETPIDPPPGHGPRHEPQPSAEGGI